MSKSFFISDVHLGLQGKQEENSKLKHLELLAEQVREEGSSLYMVGDILDYWMEFRHVIPKYSERFFCLLGTLVRHGIHVHYYAGNHDFYLGDFFRKELGVQTWYGMQQVAIGGRQFIITHGDGLDRNDISYHLFVKLVRNRFNLSLLSNFQPDLAIAIMRMFSRLSRKHGRQNMDVESDFLHGYAEALTGEKDFDYFVCGHSHVPGKKVLSNSRSEYINLGTWINGTYPYGVFEKGVFSLREQS